MSRRNRQLAVVCFACDYRLRMSRTQMARGLPRCGVCEERMVPEANDVAAEVLPLDELRWHPAWEEYEAEMNRAAAQATFKNGRRQLRCRECRSIRCGRRDDGHFPACARCGDDREPERHKVYPRERRLADALATGNDDIPF